MIRSSKLSIKFSNKIKKDNIKLFIDEYKIVTQFFINCLWNLNDIPKLIPKIITNQVDTWLSQRAIQCAAKQASGIVRGSKQKNKQRVHIYNKLLAEGKFRKAKKLKKIIDKNQENKPSIKYIQPELDSRFVKFDFDNKTSFDGWITLTSLGNKLKIQIPIKKTKHFNSLNGNLKCGIRLSEKYVTLIFENKVDNRIDGDILGLDIGIKTIASLSDGQVTKEDQHGWTLTKIIDRLNRKEKGSKGYKKVQRQRSQFINWSINQLNFSKTKKLKLENIKDIRRNKKMNKFLNRWTYTEIKTKLELVCEKFGVQIEYINPTYTSQRCSSCGWVRNSNRKGKLFKCDKCGFSLDSDLNASRNIAIDLPCISKKERLLQKNKIGFYLNEVR